MSGESETKTNQMNIQIESEPNCIKKLLVEIPADDVSAKRGDILKSFKKQAKIAGFRPGKAPEAIVAKRYKTDIDGELLNGLVQESIQKGVKEHSLRILYVENVKEGTVVEGQPLNIEVKVVVNPEFEVPEYKNLELSSQSVEVTDNDVEDALERLRKEQGNYEKVEDRAVQSGDFVQVDYSATLDGISFEESTIGGEEKKNLEIFFTNKKHWLEVGGRELIPGFTEQLVGTKIEESKEFDLTFPEEFLAPELSGKSLHYTVKIYEIRELQLADLDDAFANAIIEGKTLEELRDEIRTEVKNQKERRNNDNLREQAVGKLIEQVEFELPERILHNETQRMVNQLVKMNQERGVDDEVLEKNQKELFETSTDSATKKLKGIYICHAIAEKEKIEVEEQEMGAHLMNMSMQYQMPVEKLVKELSEHNQMNAIREQLLVGKVLDFIVENANLKQETAEAPASE